MSAQRKSADLVLSGGGVKGIAHAGALGVFEQAGYRFERVAGASAGAIAASLGAAGMSSERIRALLMDELDYTKFKDRSPRDRIPLLGPSLSLLLENGLYEGAYFTSWLERVLAELEVETFGDLRIDDRGSSLLPEQSYRLVVLTTDITRGELVRLPWDYRDKYGLDPDSQRVADAVRASMSIPLFFEPARLIAADGRESTLVDGGVLSNFPIDTFDRTDEACPRWPTFGMTLFPGLPAGNDAIFPRLGIPRRGLVRYLESLVTTTIVGHDQGYLDKPWVKARSFEIDTTSVSPIDFGIDDEQETLLYERGAAAAKDFLASWDWQSYLERFRPACV
jgi:NTE family protein